MKSKLNAIKLSIVVPCYNEQEVIIETNKRLTKLVHTWVDKGKIENYEIIYVDDGSTDKTFNLLATFARNNSKIKVISFSRNFGHQAALSAGLFYASGDAIVTIDADLQDPPEIIGQMLEKFKKGYDVIYGVRKKRETDTFFKRFTAELFYKLMKFMGVDLVYNHADFRLMSRAVVEEFKKMHEVNRFLRGMIPYLGFKKDFVYYDRMERFAGKTKYPIKKMLALAWEGITSFTYVPLRIASILGSIITFVSFFLMVWALGVKLWGHSIPSWASTVIPIYFLGGLHLLFLGVVGEYIGKIYMEVKRRPIVIVKRLINFED